MSVEVFVEPSDSSFQAQASSSSLGASDLPQFLSVQDVRITPGHMLFENAYEGKSYRQKLVIQNCGRNLAHVKLLHPNSSTFEYAPFERGLHLSSGMKVVRLVKFTYRTAIGTVEGSAPIWINNEEVTYRFIVTLTKAIINIEPHVIDFGKMDAVNRTSTRILTITNDGLRAATFAVDLGRNLLELNVYPMKGIVYAKSSVHVTIEIVGTEGGDFIEEFWIKICPPLRVIVKGTFIAPMLEVRKFITGLDFKFVEFPVTYYGSRNVQVILVKNSSSSDTMFCVMGESKNITMTLEEAKKVDISYQNFDILPIDGRIEANKGSLIQITFTPVKTRPRNRNYAACFFKVIRMDCQDIQNDKIYENSYSSNYGSIGKPVVSAMNLDYEDTSLKNVSFLHSADTDSFNFEHSIRVCIHGEKEVADVQLTPDELYLNELTIDRNYQRTILIKNKSTKLPIKVKYNKVACVFAKPPEFELGPCESLEVLIVIRTFRFGSITRKITFDLLSSYKSLEKYITTKVGSSSIKIHLETLEITNVVRVKRCMLYTDLSEKLTPELPFKVTEEELANKVKNNKYYINYLRSLKDHLPIQKGLEEYFITNSKLPLRKDLKCFNPHSKYKPQAPETSFYPLAPRLLYNIKITPKSIILRNITAHSTIAEFFEINNLNTFPIRIFVKASKSNLFFEDNGRYIIRGGEKKKIIFVLNTSAVGRYYVNISILVNDSTLYEVTAVGSVVPKVVNLDCDKLEFKNTTGDYKFIKLTNPFNCFASFAWDVSSGNFNIYPRDGRIRPERSILCKVTMEPNPAEPAATECSLLSEGGQSTPVTLIYLKESPSVVLKPFNNDFGLIPLNIPRKKKIIMKNLKNFKMYYRILNPFPLPGITMEPEDGTVDPLDSIVLVINVLLKSVIEFDIQIIILIDEELEMKIPLHGIVEYPNVCFHPNSLYFRKIAPYSFDTHAFRIQNLSKCECRLTFPFHELPEFTITESESEHYPHQEDVMLVQNESKLLYMHFHPEYTSTHSLYLTYVINDILGPAGSAIVGGESTMFFLKESLSLYQKLTNVKMRIIPSSLNIVRIYSTAVEKKIQLSDLEIDFKYFGEDHCNNVTSSDFVITNICDEITAVCIRTDDLEGSCFSLIPKSSNNLESYNVSYKVEIAPGEKAIFEARFYPDDVKTYKIKLPIFLRNYYDNKIFNYLTLKGVYIIPLIVPSKEYLNFEPVSTKIINKVSLTLELQNHSENCKLSLCEEFSFLYVDFQQKQGSSSVDVDVICSCEETKCLDMDIVFKCTCGSTCSVSVTGVIENSVLTSHVFLYFLLNESAVNHLLSPGLYSSQGDPWWCRFYRPRLRPTTHLNVTCYPLFPADDDSTSYAKYMRCINKTLEKWIYSQAFYKKEYYNIPEGFSHFSKINSEKQIVCSSFKKPRTLELPIVTLVVNFTGRTIREKLEIIPDTDDELVWFAYTHRTNTAILHYLRSFPVFVPHVKSKFLLNYDQYLIYEKIKHPKLTPMDESKFYRLSKQSWIDLILQIIKTFVLFHSIPEITFEEKLHSVSSMSTTEEFENIFDTGMYGMREKFLLNWLQTLYDKEKDTLWQTPAKDIELTYFDEHLRNGLVLGAVTAHFCPYIKIEIQDMYSDPQTAEEFHHNACILVETWNMLHLSYVIKPSEILTGSMVELLLLVTYLYNVLPNLKPKGKIKIEAKLTQRNSTSIELENTGQDPIYYTIIFFDNQKDMFYVTRNNVTVPPHHVTTIKVYFHARSVTNKTVTLLFSGETPGHKYGKSLAMTLEGISDISYVCMEIPINVSLYKLCEFPLIFQSPFKKETVYKLLVGFRSINSERTLLYVYDEVKTTLKIFELLVVNDMFTFDAEGQFETSATACLRQVGPRYIWLYFTNPEVGDWGVKLILTGLVNETCFENINVSIPENYNNLVCRCKNKTKININCPKIINVMLPKMNTFLWNARKVMILHQTKNGAQEFWAQRIFTPTGTHVLKLILEEEDWPLRERLEDDVEYTTQTDQSSPVVTLRKVTVKDVISQEMFSFPIHARKNHNLLEVKQCKLRLISEDGTETRFYRLHFNDISQSRSDVVQ